jgi:hypothetical protein
LSILQSFFSYLFSSICCLDIGVHFNAQGLLWAALAWAVWAAWEFAIVRFSPEANIRVDLLLIIPVVIGLSIAAIVLLFIKRR